MKILVVLFLILGTSHSVIAQTQNTNWFTGNGENNGRILKWSGSGLEIADSTQMGTVLTSAVVSDKNGNLLFYTNGCRVFNKLHLPLLNGGEIPCQPSNWTAPASNVYLSSGSDFLNNAVIINDPGDSNRYYLVATDTWTATGPGEVLYYNVVDMNLDGGLGGFVAPFNRVLDSVAYDAVCGKLTAIRHANGRDWWLLNAMGDILLSDPTQPTSGYLNGFYLKRYLLTPQGIVDSASQFYCHAATDGNHRYGEISVNKKGDQIALANFNRSLIIMDFDRCSGLHSNCEVIDTLQIVDILTNDYFLNACFSPSGNVLYASTGKQLYQYDLLDSNPSTTRVLLDSITMNSDVSESDCGSIGELELGLDGRIYFNISKCRYWDYTAADTPYLWLRRIEYPDSLGWACQLNNHALYIGVQAWGLPNLVNWELGALVGSECDTLDFTTALLGEHAFTATIFPNPATTEATLVLSKPAPHLMELILFDVLGKVSLHAVVPKNQKYVSIDLSGLSDGIYFYRLGKNDKHTVNGKLVVVR